MGKASFRGRPYVKMVKGEDLDGYKNGLDVAGFDRDGFARDGFNAEGFDRQGYNREGFDQYGYTREGYDRYGYDLTGYDCFERDKWGRPRKYGDMFWFVDSKSEDEYMRLETERYNARLNAVQKAEKAKQETVMWNGYFYNRHMASLRREWSAEDELKAFKDEQEFIRLVNSERQAERDMLAEFDGDLPEDHDAEIMDDLAWEDHENLKRRALSRRERDIKHREKVVVPYRRLKAQSEQKSKRIPVQNPAFTLTEKELAKFQADIKCSCKCSTKRQRKSEQRKKERRLEAQRKADLKKWQEQKRKDAELLQHLEDEYNLRRSMSFTEYVKYCVSKRNNETRIS